METSESRPEIGDAIGGPWQEVVGACEQALAARPDLVPLWVGLSLAAARAGDLELAEGAYDVARVLSADEADAWRDAFERAFP
jgi:cytochrome c-type biogenesis protein CcmH/NrfG